MMLNQTIRVVSIVLAVACTLMFVQFDTAAAANCTGTGNYSISGYTRTGSGAGVGGVTVSLSGPKGCTNSAKTTSRGFYSFLNLAKGTYTVTPSKAGCVFSPVSKVVTVSGNMTASFKATCAP